MPESLEILKMRALICFLNEDPALCTVTGLADILGEGKQKISRLLMSLEKRGAARPQRPAAAAADAGRARTGRLL